MKKMQVLFFAIILMSTACSAGQDTVLISEKSHRSEIEKNTKGNMSNVDNDNQLTLDDVINELELEGLELKSTEVKKEWVLEGNQPYRFTIRALNEDYNPSEHVSIYVFDSEQGRKKGLEHFHEQTKLIDLVIPHIYEKKNILIFYWIEGNLNEPSRYSSQIENSVQQL